MFTYIFRHLNRIKKIQKTYDSGKTKESSKMMDDMLVPVIDKLLKISGARITVKGTEFISKDENYLFVGNHQGNFDIPVLYHVSPVKMSFVAKKEMEKIPLLGMAMKARGCIFLDRENPRNAIKGINDGIKLLKSGYSLSLFPEGTRSKGETMNEFKTGGLRLALKSGVKVIPVTMQGTYKMMEQNNGIIIPNDVQITFSAPIDSTLYSDVNQLASDIKAIIQSNLSHSTLF
jgi:1-acyl-sn-glycerol-3-phosphate acyltransferase